MLQCVVQQMFALQFVFLKQMHINVFHKSRRIPYRVQILDNNSTTYGSFFETIFEKLGISPDSNYAIYKTSDYDPNNKFCKQRLDTYIRVEDLQNKTLYLSELVTFKVTYTRPNDDQSREISILLHEHKQISTIIEHMANKLLVPDTTIYLTFKGFILKPTQTLIHYGIKNDSQLEMNYY
jgi:hypothetical protein